MLQTLLRNWTAMRLIRLVLSVIIIAQSIAANDTAMTFAGIFLLLTAVANIGCCGANGCTTSAYKKADPTKKDQPVTYEEVV
jgi:predicted Abi (CAAX) family protease